MTRALTPPATAEISPTTAPAQETIQEVVQEPVQESDSETVLTNTDPELQQMGQNKRILTL